MLEKYDNFMILMKKLFNTDKDYMVGKHISLLIAVIGACLYYEFSTIEKEEFKH
ncbi:MAG: hypothetical protein ACI4XM_01305 [Candidatus Coprovivens sp.]